MLKKQENSHITNTSNCDQNNNQSKNLRVIIDKFGKKTFYLQISYQIVKNILNSSKKSN